VKLEREDERMEQPTCSLCEAKVSRVMRARVGLPCTRSPDMFIHEQLVRICRACAAHVIEALK
jgi:hypothetical protein